MARRGRGEGPSTGAQTAAGRRLSPLATAQRWADAASEMFGSSLWRPAEPLEQGIVLSGSSQRVEEYLIRWRHTAASHLLRCGVHPKVVQDLLGHSTISLTPDTYSHVAPALHAEVASHMQALFG